MIQGDGMTPFAAEHAISWGKREPPFAKKRLFSRSVRVFFPLFLLILKVGTVLAIYLVCDRKHKKKKPMEVMI